MPIRPELGLELLVGLRDGASGSREEDAFLLFAVERTADGIADGETAALGLDEPAILELLAGVVERRLRG